MSNKPINTVVLVTLLIGGAASLFLMFITGHNNKSVILMTLFTIWVLSPYLALFGTHQKNMVSTKQLNYLAPFISIGSSISYTISYFSTDKTPAFIYLLIPFISWLLIVIVIVVSKKKPV